MSTAWQQGVGGGGRISTTLTFMSGCAAQPLVPPHSRVNAGKRLKQLGSYILGKGLSTPTCESVTISLGPGCASTGCRARRKRARSASTSEGSELR